MKKLFLLVNILFHFIISAQEKWSSNSVVEFQTQMNTKFSDSLKSPLTKEDRVEFRELDFFPINSKYAVEAQFVRTENEKIFKMKTSTARLPEYLKYGEFHFTIDNVRCKLNVYQNIDLIKKPGYEDYLFLPFSDLTCGKESYIGGRYIDIKIPTSETIILDFNKSYNPYCAYNHKYSCPIVPLENNLTIEIKAGVKKFHD